MPKVKTPQVAGEYLISHFAWWLSVSEMELQAIWSACDVPSLSPEQLRLCDLSAADQLIRKVAYAATRFIPKKLHNTTKTVLKAVRRQIRSRNRLLPARAPVKNSPWHLAIERLQAGLVKGNCAIHTTKPGPAICLTHDVDTLDCFNSIPGITSLEQKYGVPSVFNFLTEGDYKYSPSLSRKLCDDGFEVGLHGTIHDWAFGYRSRSHIEKHVKCAFDKMGVPVFGYRAPAFAISETLMTVLESCGIIYDSSLHVWHPMYPSIGLAFPYRYPSRKLFEFPVSIEDSLLFDDFKLDEKKVLSFIMQTIEMVCGLNGVCVINVHPYRMKQYPCFFEELLGFIKSMDRTATILTPVKILNRASQIPGR